MVESWLGMTDADGDPTPLITDEDARRLLGMEPASRYHVHTGPDDVKCHGSRPTFEAALALAEDVAPATVWRGGLQGQLICRVGLEA